MRSTLFYQVYAGKLCEKSWSSLDRLATFCSNLEGNKKLELS
jgi:hypothetical protein